MTRKVKKSSNSSRLSSKSTRRRVSALRSKRKSRRNRYKKSTARGGVGQRESAKRGLSAIREQIREDNILDEQLGPTSSVVSKVNKFKRLSENSEPNPKQKITRVQSEDCNSKVQNINNHITMLISKNKRLNKYDELSSIPRGSLARALQTKLSLSYDKLLEKLSCAKNKFAPSFEEEFEDELFRISKKSVNEIIEISHKNIETMEYNDVLSVYKFWRLIESTTRKALRSKSWKEATVGCNKTDKTNKDRIRSDLSRETSLAAQDAARALLAYDKQIEEDIDKEAQLQYMSDMQACSLDDNLFPYEMYREPTPTFTSDTVPLGFSPIKSKETVNKMPAVSSYDIHDDLLLELETDD